MTENTAYISPFVCTEDHESPDPVLCLSRANSTDPITETFTEFAMAAGEIIRSPLELGQPAFFLTRQVAELALKALLTPPAQGPTFGHNLDKLLDHLEQNGDDLFTGGTDREHIIAFIRELAHLDPGGDEGRYPHTRPGTPALSAVCHTDPKLLLTQLNRLVTYTLTRLGAPPTLTV
ncbi:HEPN domain-containing protein [Nocardia sp. NPDC058518]|uniref:HEPN domain-containing protein n=1 Tax=Nocardia sp. NPDC058518 TaxID=3346534 RepID=UPI00365CF018